jgi:hypothetical protein
MMPHRCTGDRRATIARGRPARPAARLDAMARALRDAPLPAATSVGYGVWQNAHTRTLLLSFPHLGQSIT